MSKVLDCTGLACPEPVLLTRQALQASEAGKVTVIVSNAVARDNVMRTAKSMGWGAEVSVAEEGFRLNLEKNIVK